MECAVDLAVSTNPKYVAAIVAVRDDPKDGGVVAPVEMACVTRRKSLPIMTEAPFLDTGGAHDNSKTSTDVWFDTSNYNTEIAECSILRARVCVKHKCLSEPPKCVKET